MVQKKNLNHLAVIMDGNGRWAKKRGMSRVFGHERGADVAIELIETCIEKKIKELTLYALSVENMTRDPEEVSFLISLFTKVLLDKKEEMGKNGVRVRVIGDRDALGKHVCQVIEHVEAHTQKNAVLQLNIAFNYSGRWQIRQAVEYARMNGKDENTESFYKRFESYLTQDVNSDPDLLIRTGGEMRLSNFMLWHLAYTELFFSDVMWPDFSTSVLEKALDAFEGRQRRYGQIPEEACASA
ncbi:MAG: polyprenyl diphosphate synthase [Pseudomonadota bacterium]|nr:polyprenyl diphosphate synthase [Pseudomonadota bacterium]